MNLKSISEKNNIEFLAGGGEMGAMIRAYDWSQTTLGTPDQWPHSLKTIIRIMLTSRQPIWIGWGKDLIKFYNDPYKSIVGGKHPWALGKPASIVWKEIWNDIEPLLQNVMDKNEGTYSEALLLIMERYGYPEETYYTFSYSPVPDDSGEIGGMFCANTDDTRQIIGERQLALLRDLASRIVNVKALDELYLHVSESLESNLKDLPFSMLYILDEKGQTLKLVGKSGIELVHPAALEEVFLADDSVWPFRKVIDSGQYEIVDNLNEAFKNLPTGSWNIPPRKVVVVPIAHSGQTGKSGVLIAGLNPYRLFDEGYQGFINLITGQIAASLANIQAYQEERKRAEALAEIDKAKTLFFSNVSHEFRTPLTLMLGPIQDALNDSATTPINQERLKIAHRNSLRLLKLVNTLLDFSRIEAGRIHAAFSLTKICQLTKDLGSAFRSAVVNAGLSFNISCEEVREPVYVDPTMWERIVFNLLSNALKYTFEGEISISLTSTGEKVELTVRDTGTGIPETELPKLFTRFHRVENAKGRTHEGSGIGLAMVNELVKIHGGTVSVKSLLGKGTSFSVTIPTGKDHLPEEQIVDGRQHKKITLNALPSLEEELGNFSHTSSEGLSISGDSETTAGKKEKILVADDNDDMREYITKLLKDNYEVVAVKDGLEALRFTENEIPSLILSDIMMPNLNGLDLVRQLRSDNRTNSLPIILLSARAGEEATVEGIEAGADDYLIKPFSAIELQARVKANVELFRLRKKIEEEVKAERKRLFELFIQAPAAIAVLDGPTQTYILANRYYQRIFNRNEEALIGRSVREVFPEIEGQGVFELFDSVYQTGQPFIANEYEVNFQRTENGPYEKGFFEFVIHPIKDSMGHVSDILIHAYEITDRIKALQKATESEAYFRRMADNVPVMIWVTEADASCSYLNQQWYEYTGQTEDKALGIGWLDATHPDDAKQAGEIFLEANSKHLPFNLEYRLKRKDGQYRWALDAGLPRFDGRGNFEGYVGAVVDIHERKLAEQELEILSKELAAANEELSASNEEISASNDELSTTNQKLTKVNSDLDNFIYTASHDLKAPIANLEGLLNALAKTLNRNEKDNKIIDLMYQSIERFKSTIKDLTEISHAQRGDSEDKVVISFKEMVNEVMLNIKDLIEKNNPVIHLNFEEPEILYSRKNLRSILYNLLSNAIKYASPERRPEITITTAKAAGYILFTIADNGLGISADKKEKMFSMFKRFHTHVEGTGIGLYIVKRIIENEDGQIEVDSEPGKGTTFKVYFKL